MKIRSEIHLGSLSSKLILVPKNEEKVDHLALKLAAFTMFLSKEPIVEPSSDHPALLSLDIRPDLMALDISGEIVLWVECGSVTLNKLDKITRRLPRTRIIVIKGTEPEAKRLRSGLEEEVRHGSRIEIWSWPVNQFQEWMTSLAEKTEIFGEAQEKSMNLVINNQAYVADLISS